MAGPQNVDPLPSHAFLDHERAVAALTPKEACDRRRKALAGGLAGVDRVAILVPEEDDGERRHEAQIRDDEAHEAQRDADEAEAKADWDEDEEPNWDDGDDPG